MSNLGMRIEASGFEVGFKAETREEFDSYLARLTMVAETIWPASAAAQPDDEPKYVNESPIDKISGAYAQERLAAGSWREDQGLR